MAKNDSRIKKSFKNKQLGGYISIDKVEETNILLHISQEKIPVINKLFCDNDVNVFSIEAKRKLEDYFLKLIKA